MAGLLEPLPTLLAEPPAPSHSIAANPRRPTLHIDVGEDNAAAAVQQQEVASWRGELVTAKPSTSAPATDPTADKTRRNKSRTGTSNGRHPRASASAQQASCVAQASNA